MRVALLALSLLAQTAPAPVPDYPAVLAGIEAHRLELAAEYAGARRSQRQAVLGSARNAVLSALRDRIFPAWTGTPWAFYGTSEAPREGSIACGYFVATVLRDAGFRLDRSELAQQASERIVKSFAPESRILRFRGVAPKEVVEEVRREEGDGLYLVGLDYHAALLLLDGERADLCHAAWYAPAGCEPAVKAQGMESRYYVVGPVLDPERLGDWLSGRPILLAPRRKASL